MPLSESLAESFGPSSLGSVNLDKALHPKGVNKGYLGLSSV